MGAYNSGLGVQQLLAAGAPTTQAVVVSIADTGKLVNFDPVVDLVLQPSGAADRVALQTIVSKLRIPRVGDQVLLIADPQPRWLPVRRGRRGAVTTPPYEVFGERHHPAHLGAQRCLQATDFRLYRKRSW